MSNFLQLQKLDTFSPVEGLRAKLIHTDHQTFAFWKIDAETILPEHQHPHQQTAIVTKGKLELNIDGTIQIIESGTVALIPSNTPHSARALSEVELLDIFYPVREDFKSTDNEVSVERQKWINHRFQFDIDVGWADNVIARIEDLVSRIQARCRHLSEEQLSIRLDGQWSIKEHIGHLIDLEELHSNRLKQFAAKLPELAAADMSNAKTKNANHNQKPIERLLTELDEVRKELINEFHTLSDSTQRHQALHPRLKAVMRPVDIMFFVGEHDDHHIATINEIIKVL